MPAIQARSFSNAPAVNALSAKNSAKSHPAGPQHMNAPRDGVHFGKKDRDTIGYLYVPVPAIAQTQNACGTTSLAMIMNHFDVPVTPAELDEKFRKFNAGVSVRMMLEATREYGLKAEAYNNSHFEEIKELLDQGHLLVAASVDTNTRKYGVRSHYVVINGYGADRDGKPMVAITDPGGGSRYWKTMESLEEKWKDPRYLGLNIGYRNTLIAISQGDKLPEKRMDKLVTATDDVGYACSHLMNGLMDLRERKIKAAAKKIARATRVGIPATGRFVIHKLRDKGPN